MKQVKSSLVKTCFPSNKSECSKKEIIEEEENKQGFFEISVRIKNIVQMKYILLTPFIR